MPAPKVQGPFVDTSGPAEVLFGADELEEGRKWNEERIERRLRGEYERAGRHLSELVRFHAGLQPGRALTAPPAQVNDNLATPLRLNAIRVLGAEKTRPSFLAAVVGPYLPSLPPAAYLSAHPIDRPQSTLRGLLATTRNLTGLLQQFDIYSDVEASLEASPSVLAEKEDVDIVLRVKEASRYFLRTATDIGDGEGNAVSLLWARKCSLYFGELTGARVQTATARIRNAFGGAEMLEGNLSFGTRTKSAFQVRPRSGVRLWPESHPNIPAVSSASTPPSTRRPSRARTCLSSAPSATSTTTRAAARRLEVSKRGYGFVFLKATRSGPRTDGLGLDQTTTGLGYHEFTYDAIHRRIADILPIASMTYVFMFTPSFSPLNPVNPKCPRRRWLVDQVVRLAHLHPRHARRSFPCHVRLAPQAEAGVRGPRWRRALCQGGRRVLALPLDPPRLRSSPPLGSLRPEQS